MGRCQTAANMIISKKYTVLLPFSDHFFFLFQSCKISCGFQGKSGTRARSIANDLYLFRDNQSLSNENRPVVSAEPTPLQTDCCRRRGISQRQWPVNRLAERPRKKRRARSEGGKVVLRIDSSLRHSWITWPLSQGVERPFRKRGQRLRG